MNHLGFEMEKVKIGSFDFTCCEGVPTAVGQQGIDLA